MISPHSRPVRPAFSEFRRLEDAPQEDRTAALNWAQSWLDAPAIDPKRAAAVLDRLLVWDTDANDGSPDALVAIVARQALFDAKEMFATKRTARSLPHVVFEEAGCEASEAFQGKTLPASERPSLPLATCSSDLCRCRIGQISRAEYRRLIERDEHQCRS